MLLALALSVIVVIELHKLVCNLQPRREEISQGA